MVKVLAAGHVDELEEEVDRAMTAAEEAALAKEVAGQFKPSGTAPDLSDGGNVNGVNIRPMTENGLAPSPRKAKNQPLPEGRPAARRAWSWNGTESLLPLAWNPEGTAHDGARRYLRKRHCLCCHSGGFQMPAGRAVQCPNCVKSRCTNCEASTLRRKVMTPAGFEISWPIIPNFYLRKEDVPFPERFYGDVSCFLSMCTRTGARGFKTEEDMRMHAASRHRMEYAAHLQTSAARERREVDELRRRIDDLMLAGRNGNGHAAPVPEPAPQTEAKTAGPNTDARSKRAAYRRDYRARQKAAKAAKATQATA